MPGQALQTNLRPHVMSGPLRPAPRLRRATSGPAALPQLNDAGGPTARALPFTPAAPSHSAVSYGGAPLLAVLSVAGPLIWLLLRRRTSPSQATDPLLPVFPAAPKAHETWSMATVSGAESQDPPLDRWTPVPLPESLPEALQALGSDATRKLLTDPDRRRYAGYQVLRGAFFLGLRNVSALQSRLLAEGAGADPAATLLTVRPNWNAKAYGCAPSLRVRRPQEGALRCDPDVEERSLMEMLRRDLENITTGVYRAPYDMDLDHRQFNPFYVLEQMQVMFETVSDTAALQVNDGRTQVRADRPDATGAFPDYYLQNFHFQPGGWLSDRSARQYEISTETFMAGLQDVMQRQGLVPLAEFMASRHEAETKLLEVACGTGRFHTFLKDNYPQMETVATDLSPNYVAAARDNLRYFREFSKHKGRPIAPVECVAAAAESLPFGDEEFDVVVSVYLFHELPAEIRRQCVKEWYRVLKPGGLVVFVDSLQRHDRPEVIPVLEDFARVTHEPYYDDYIENDVTPVFKSEGFTFESHRLAWISKALAFRK